MHELREIVSSSLTTASISPYENESDSIFSRNEPYVEVQEVSSRPQSISVVVLSEKSAKYRKPDGMVA